MYITYSYIKRKPNLLFLLWSQIHVFSFFLSAIVVLFPQWSLGVTLWELATLGASPLAELDAADVGAFLSGGYRPSQPHNCPDEL